MRLRFIALLCAVMLSFPLVLRTNAAGLHENTRTSTIFIANYNRDGYFAGWGSGFFVDEGIAITNKHVIEGGNSYRIFATKSDGSVDLGCYKDISKADMKINLEDDVAYVRVYLPCAHGVVRFAAHDPAPGEKVEVLGFPNRGTVMASLNLSTTTGSVTGALESKWLKTDAYIHFGNSGGPVVHNNLVVGVAVAKAVDREGNYVTGLFVPVSVIIKGLEYANDSTFGYTPQIEQGNSAYSSSSMRSYDPFHPQRSGNASNAQCVESLGQGGEATGSGGCRCRKSYHKDAAGKACLPGAEVKKKASTSRTPVKDPAASKRQRQRVKESGKNVKIYIKKRGI
ncbi:hypothetical protein A3G69_02110 [Candidatus Peribacteria bacterium RIFCSPLOWO2_12_FULL_53_10]|nr:MAG: hypothetical protein A3B61_05080 [Candidatus Peribacteria bacterium RIFCSPLOWO2_01_FULL_53_10]OGJ70232.1 MAG: hypothetical protein A3G69_02110 [Candidatus Peribacteria bacterium RIFCSPLOWO2_12_FULL_53_10]